MHVVLGISGGVDSAVSAYLLKKAGYDVTALFMKNWQADQNDPYCTLEEDLIDSQKVAQKLGINFEVVNFSQEYWQNVFQYFLDEYAKNRTPNPDVLCNKEIKFKAFLNYAVNNLHADYIAMGHYARTLEKDKHHYLLKGSDFTKDQSYFLHLLTEQQLAKSLFPVGDMTKKQVREIALQLNLPNAKKKDSTGICFIGERNFKNFLSEYLLNKKGEIVDEQNHLLGFHDGLMYYTIGQRRGLHIGGIKGLPEAAFYVARKDIKNNRLIVVQNKNHPDLWGKTLFVHNLHFINGPRNLPFSCNAQIRYRAKDAKCVVTKENDQYKITFAEPQFAIAPGQSVVLYDGDICLGGGVIDA